MAKQERKAFKDWFDRRAALALAKQISHAYPAFDEKAFEDPAPIWPILEALKDDEELYVRRSVANSLNDLTKDHPNAVLALLKQWSKGGNKNTDWIIKHALRGLIKAGDTNALALIGFKKPDKIMVTLEVKPAKIKIGGSVSLQAELKNASEREQALLVDYVVYYQSKQGSERAKVFKWKTLNLGSKESAEISKKHPMRLTSIRALYPGSHRVELQVNGVILANKNFTLID